MSNKVDCDYLKKLTDDFGVWQHAMHKDILTSEGYALDDAARALIVYVMAGEQPQAQVCLNYIVHSWQGNHFIGFFDSQRQARDFPASFDASALAIWALAFAKSYGFEISTCQQLLAQIDISEFYNIEHLRSQAYLLTAQTLLGNKKEAERLVLRIVEAFHWDVNWFERKLTYANAAIPMAIYFYCHAFSIQDQKIENTLRAACTSLEKYLRIGAIPAPIGNRVWFEMLQPARDIYGQQPIDAAFMVLMYIESTKFYRDKNLLHKANDWLKWFRGDNIWKSSLITNSNACADGLDEHGVSKNYGAESTIMYLWAKLALQQAKSGQV